MNHPLSLAPDFVLSKAAPLRYSGTLNPTLNLTAQQMEMLQSKLGTQQYQQPGPRTRTLGYRGFVVQGLPVLRGCVSAGRCRDERHQGRKNDMKNPQFFFDNGTLPKMFHTYYESFITNFGKHKSTNKNPKVQMRSFTCWSFSDHNFLNLGVGTPRYRGGVRQRQGSHPMVSMEDRVLEGMNCRQITQHFNGLLFRNKLF